MTDRERNETTLSSIMKEKPISNGFDGRGESATEEDGILLGLTPEQLPYVSIIGRHGSLAMFHFLDRDQKTVSKVHSIRGWVVNINTNEVVCPSYSETSISFIDPVLLMDPVFEGVEIKPYIEGLTIRMFWDGEKWIHVAHRKIDCTNSNIPGCSKTYVEMFHDACPTFNYDQLNKAMTYVFLVYNTESQIMNPDPVTEAGVYHMATISGRRPSEFKLEEGPALTGVWYLNSIDQKKAISILQEGKFVMVHDGFDLIKIGDLGSEKLMEIRGYDKHRDVPVELMYMRLSPEDRPALFHAVPFHLKQKATSTYMSQYMVEYTRRLAAYCAQLAVFGSSRGPSKLSKPMVSLFQILKFPRHRVREDKLAGIYYECIKNLSNTKGDLIYSCFKDMDRTIENAQKRMAAPKAQIVDVVYTVNNEEFIVREKLPPISNVTVSYVEDAKKYRRRRQAQSSSSATTNEAAELLALMKK